MIRHRFNFLLVMLILLLLTAPFVSEWGFAARLTLSFVFFGLLLSSVYAVSERRHQLITAGTMAFATIVLRATELYLNETNSPWIPVRISALVVEIICFGYTVVLILRYQFSTDRVTFDMICASLCAYLLLGVIWSEVYILVSIENPTAFDPGFPEAIAAKDNPPGGPDPVSMHPEPSLPAEGPAPRLEDSAGIEKIFVTALYLSFVTLTTLGYGDITPVSSGARMLTVVQAIIGQFYLTVLVARLVGLHIARSTTRAADAGS